jgi:hypothetical protein
MTAVEQAEWAVGDDCFYRVSQYAAAPVPCVVSAIDGAVLTITTASRYSQTFYVFAEEITRREL